MTRSIASPFGDIHVLAAAVIAFAGQAFGIFVGQNRSLRFQYRPGNDVLGGDQLDLIALAPKLFSITSAISGSTSFNGVEKRASISPAALGFDVADITISWRRELSAPNDEIGPGLRPEIAYRRRTAKHWAVDRLRPQHLGAAFGPRRRKKNPGRKAAGAIPIPPEVELEPVKDLVGPEALEPVQ